MGGAQQLVITCLGMTRMVFNKLIFPYSSKANDLMDAFHLALTASDSFCVKVDWVSSYHIYIE